MRVSNPPATTAKGNDVALIEITPREAESLFDRLDLWYEAAVQPDAATAMPAPTSEHSAHTSVDGSPLNS
jgi:hypothetical protein